MKNITDALENLLVQALFHETEARAAWRAAQEASPDYEDDDSTHARIDKLTYRVRRLEAAQKHYEHCWDVVERVRATLKTAEAL